MEEKQVNEFLDRKNYFHVKKYRSDLKEKLVEYKGGKCEVCGYSKCIEALEFHHLDPAEKEFGVSSYTSLSFEKAKKEVDKCILVCANCHREIHHMLNEEKRKNEGEREKKVFSEILKNREQYGSIKKIRNSYKFLLDAGILEDLKLGVDRKEIFAKYHINNRTFNKFLKENNIEYTKKKVIDNKPTKEELEIMLKTLSKNALSRLYNVSWHTINKWCKNYGI